jgi:transcriptional regulator with XRE-family HTH domain
MAKAKVHPATDALAFNVRVLRLKRNNMSQIALAAEANMSPNTIGDMEKRIGNPRLKTLQQLADTLGVEVAALFAKPE